MLEDKNADNKQHIIQINHSQDKIIYSILNCLQTSYICVEEGIVEMVIFPYLGPSWNVVIAAVTSSETDHVVQCRVEFIFYQIQARKSNFSLISEWHIL